GAILIVLEYHSLERNNRPKAKRTSSSGNSLAICVVLTNWLKTWRAKGSKVVYSGRNGCFTAEAPYNRTHEITQSSNAVNNKNNNNNHPSRQNQHKTKTYLS